MTEYACYMIRLTSGSTYIGVTGQGLRRRISRHKREGRFGSEFEVVVLGWASNRVAINLLEKAMIAIYRPDLNRIKGGTSIDGYRHGQSARRKVPLLKRKRSANRRVKGRDIYCRQGHELTSGRCKKCAKAYQANYYANKLRPSYLKTT